MRLKRVPEPPPALSDLATLQRAIPLVPGSTDDCCARLRDRCDLPDRETASDWLAFLRAIGLARERCRRFVRTDLEPTAERVREGLRAEVLFVPESLALLRSASPDDPVTASDVHAETRTAVPRHDRERDPNWERTWRERADRLLGWLALAGLARPVERDADGGETGDGDETGYVAGEAA